MSAEAEEVDLYEPPQLLRELAQEAMICGVDPNEEQKLCDVLERIHLGYGHQGLYTTTLIWSDIALNMLGAPYLPDGTRLLELRQEIEATIAIGIYINPAAAWASRLILARADLDWKQCQELYEELARTYLDDGYVRALLNFTVIASHIGDLLGRGPGSQ